VFHTCPRQPIRGTMRTLHQLYIILLLPCRQLGVPRDSNSDCYGLCETVENLAYFKRESGGTICPCTMCRLHGARSVLTTKVTLFLKEKRDNKRGCCLALCTSSVYTVPKIRQIFWRRKSLEKKYPILLGNEASFPCFIGNFPSRRIPTTLGN
jgi:hypothetical protein